MEFTREIEATLEAVALDLNAEELEEVVTPVWGFGCPCHFWN